MPRSLLTERVLIDIANRELEADGMVRQDDGQAQKTVGTVINTVGDTAKSLKHNLGT